MRAVASLVLLVGLSACGGDDSLRLSANPSAFAADGITIVTLSARVTFRGDALPDGKRITFSTEDALLFDTKEDVEAGEGATSVQAPTRGGEARAYLLSPLEGGDIEVTASYTTINKDVLKDTVTLRIEKPMLVSAGRYSTNPAFATVQFAFTCARNIGGIDNIGAFVGNREAISVPCSLYAQDFAGNDLPNVPLRLYAEAGTFTDVAADGDEPRVITYDVPATLAVLPRDVEPTSAETSAGLVDFDAQSNTVNPRDGLVSLLAVVRGHEAFDDANGNSEYDVGELFLDEGEPFLDVDDNGVYDVEIDGPFCCDWNGNGDVDGPNGKFDSGVLIGRMTHILWTGELDPTRSFLYPTTLDLGADETLDVSLRLVDKRGNPIAASDNNDSVQISASPSTKVLVSVPAGMSADDIPLPNATGLVLLHHPAFLFGYDTPAFSDVVMDDVTFFRDWRFSIGDKRTSTQCAGASISVNVTVRATPAPGLERLTHELGATGTLADRDPCP